MARYYAEQDSILHAILFEQGIMIATQRSVISDYALAHSANMKTIALVEQDNKYYRGMALDEQRKRKRWQFLCGALTVGMIVTIVSL